MKHLSRSLRLAALLAVGVCAVARAESIYENYTFTNLAGLGPGSRDGSNSVARFSSPSGVTVDGAGNVYVADTDNHTLRKILPVGRVATVAGLAGSSGSADGTGGGAQFNLPRKAAADSAGNLYVVDSGNQIIRKITPAGVVTTLAGGVGVTGTNDGPGTYARFHNPLGVAVDGTGNAYVADTYNHTIRKITPGGVVTTLAGTPGVHGTNNGTGGAAKFYYPFGLAVDTNGSVYVADTYNQVIRKITAAGAVTTFAGKMSTPGIANGTSTTARFYDPTGISVGSGGTLYVADYANNEIRMLTSSGTVSTLAGFAQFDLSGNPIGGSANGTGSAARFDQPFDAAADPSTGLLYVADSGNQLIRKITSAGVVTTLAGQIGGSGTNNGTGSAARFRIPSSTAVDGNGNVYVADLQNHAIRKITSAGVETTLAGLPGTSGTNNGTGTAARFNYPIGTAVDGNGNVYVADYENSAIRKITSAGVVTTLAGLLGTTGTNNGTGTAARFNTPVGVAVDTNGNVYVGDSANYMIRKITSAGVVTTLAGLAGTSGTNNGVGGAARFNFPEGVAVDRSNYVYVADSANHCIRKVAPDGTVTTLAGLCGTSGSDDGTNSAARFYYPFGVSVDSAGNLYVGDTGNQTVRKITPDGVVTTIAGLAGASGNTDGSGSDARFYNPEGVAVDANGFVYVADSDNGNIRKGYPAPSDQPVVDLPIASIGTVRHLDVTNLTTTSWSWSIVRFPAGGTAQLSATNVSNPTLNPDATNDFYVVQFQGWDSLGRPAIRTVSVGDYMRPQVVIVSPTWDQQIYGPLWTVTGTATDDVQVASVQVQLNDGPWLTPSGLTNWTSQMMLTQGVNTISAYAVDSLGLFSATNSVSVVRAGQWLTITPTDTNSLVVSWPLPADGWVLEWTNSVPSVSNTWPQISPPYQTNAAQAWIVVPAPTGNAFYRLYKP